MLRFPLFPFINENISMEIDYKTECCVSGQTNLGQGFGEVPTCERDLVWGMLQTVQ